MRKKYKVRIPVVEVLEFTGGNESANEIMAWVRESGMMAEWRGGIGTSQHIVIEGKNDYLVLNFGDFLVVHDGGFHQYSAPDFHQKYEAVDTKKGN